MLDFLIVLMTKIIILGLKILGKKGGNLPGQIAYNLNNKIFKYFKIDCPIIAVVRNKW